ncbi:hypothetical protein NA57DRAFT_70149 [Rhizodiscina lignyota]|uniref:DUF7907 domain-containing protein n=1 Tax=Rhizodiscina lignyota TaxID=1504668 RepID=A0A9P4IT14_9PEZI|nr:hypothetical protein NA57DRAFT_70149 [Rhizodiscina lignyota]
MSDQKQYFYLKVHACTNPEYNGRYLRYTGSGHADIVLTPDHPKFIKFYLEDEKLMASFKDKVFGFCMSVDHDEGGEDHAGTRLYKVEIFENRADIGFSFGPDKEQLLRWRVIVAVQKPTDSQKATSQWKSWACRENPADMYKGYPQLYWTTEDVSEDWSDGIEKLEIIAEYL